MRFFGFDSINTKFQYQAQPIATVCPIEKDKTHMKFYSEIDSVIKNWFGFTVLFDIHTMRTLASLNRLKVYSIIGNMQNEMILMRVKKKVIRSSDNHIGFHITLKARRFVIDSNFRLIK